MADYGSLKVSDIEHEAGFETVDGTSERASKSGNNYFVVFLVGVACILGASFLVTVNIDSIRGASVKTTSLLQKSESIYAPLSLQEITHENMIPTLLEKYGLVGTEDVLDQYDTTYDASTATKGWAYVEVYKGSDCTSTEYTKGGILTGVCLPVYGYDDVDYEESLVFNCVDGNIIVNKYNGSSCTDQALSATKIATTGCKKRTSEEYGTYFHNMQCSTGGGLPVVGSYSLFKGYIDQDPGVCKNAVLFEASQLNTCMPITKDDEKHSIMFDHFNKEANMDLFYNSDSCNGKAASADLASDCTEVSKSNPSFPLDAEISYTWEYYDSKEEI